MRASRTVAIILGMGLLASVSVRAEETKQTVLVTDLRAAGVPATDAEGLTALLAEKVAARTELRVLTTDELKQMFDLQATVSATGCSDDACLAELTRAAHARFALSGSLGRVGEEVVLSLTLLDAEAGTSVGSSMRSARSLEELRPLIEDMAVEIFAAEGTESAEVRYALPEGKEVSFAVYDLKPLGIDADAALNLTQVLAVELKKVDGTSVISRDDIVSLLQMESDKQAIGCDDMSCLAEIGGALGVEMLVVGQAGKVAQNYVVSLRMIHVRRSEVVGRVTETFEGEEGQLLAAVRQAGRRLLGIESATPGGLAVSSNEPGAEVFLDNEPVGTLPLPPLADLPPGRHMLRVSKPDFYDWRSHVFVEPGQTSAVWAEVTELPPKWYQTWWFWGAVGAVVVGGAAAAIVALQPVDQPEIGGGQAVIRGGTP